MGVAELAIVSVLGLLLPLGLVGGTVGLWFWARSVARRLGGGWWRHATWLPLVALGLFVLDGAMTVRQLIHVFAGVAGVDPSVKSTLLAKGISEAMNCAAFNALPSVLLFIASVVVSTVGSLRRRA